MMLGSGKKNFRISDLRLKTVCMDVGYLQRRLHRQLDASRSSPYPVLRDTAVNYTGCARSECYKRARKSNSRLVPVEKVRGSLCLKRSNIHGFGVFTVIPIAPGEKVAEYVGEIVRPIIGLMRQLRITPSQSYMFRISDQKVIDATNQGNITRFINHSCDPNCFVKTEEVSGELKLYIYANRPIGKDEEITIDYNFSPTQNENLKIPCFCGAPTCRKYMN